AVRAAGVKHEFGERDISLVACDSIQLRQAHLDDLVAGPDHLLTGPESAVKQIRGPERYIEQRALSGGLVMRYRRLVEVPEVIQFVAVDRFEFQRFVPAHLCGLMGSIVRAV